MLRACGSFKVIRSRFWASLVAVVALGCGVLLPAQACNVPVFRYALERWPADSYRLSVYYTRQLDPALAKQLDVLAQRPLNMEVSLVDLQKTDPKDRRLAGVAIDRGKLPWIVLCYPDRGDPPRVAWSGRLESGVLDRIADSPVRREIVRRILSGESAVWILLESGDAQKNRSAREQLQRAITTAGKRFHLPAAEELDYSADDSMPDSAPDASDGLAAKIPLKVAFSLLTLSRKDAKEEILRAVLLGSEPDLKEYSCEPMAFLVFGQGRVLWALVGKGVNADNVLEACEFLTEGCSCQIKSTNPGTDLLTCTDWCRFLQRPLSIEEVSLAQLTTVTPPLQGQRKIVRQQQALPSVGNKLIATTVAGAVAGAPAEDRAGEPEKKGGQSPSVQSRAPGETWSRDVPANGDGSLSSVLIGVGAVLGVMLVVVVGATIVLVARKQQ
jgi:hypothetical protein